MSYDIKGKTALITGANRGIGKATVLTFLEHGIGKVYAGVRELAKAGPLVEGHGDKIIPLRIDYTDPDSIRAAAETATDVEIVVSNAGLLNGAPVTADDVFERFEEEIEVNVRGLLRMARAFGPILKANGGGAFVQMNSVASMCSFPDFATYPASKAAAYSFTQALRGIFKEQGTQVLSVHPGPIDTDMAEKAGLADVADPVTVVSEGIVESLKQGDFHLFPDSMAHDMGAVYAEFARKVVET